MEQDHDDAVGCPTTWIPAEISGNETGGADDFVPTGLEGDLFTNPENVKAIHTNDKWHKPGPEFDVLAEQGGHIVIAQLLLFEHGLGDGAYFITGMQNENQGQVVINLDIVTNLYFRAATLRQDIRAVDSVGKLATTWGKLKGSVR